MAHHTRLSALQTIVVAIFTFAFAAEAAFEKGHVHIPFIRGGTVKGPRLSNRDADSGTSVGIGSDHLPWVVKVEVGTPPQSMFLAISTITGLSWLQDAAGSNCQPWTDRVYNPDDPYAEPTLVEVPSQCKMGTYNKTLSSTYLKANYLYEYFDVATSNGGSTSGKNMTDDLALGGFEIENMPMGLVSYASDTYTGVLGLGKYIKSSEYNDEFPYAPRFMDRVVAGGHAKTRAYSIWLDDPEGKSGQLLLGAIDQSAYEGDLLRLKTETYEYSYSGDFVVTLSKLESAADADAELEEARSNDFPISAAISPNDLYSFMPESVVNNIVALTGATLNSSDYSSSSEYATIPCDAAKTNNARFRLRIGGAEGPVLNFQTADVIIPREVATPSHLRDKPNVCLLAVQKNYYYDSREYNLGGALLRRSYLVFDLENNELAIAPVKFKPTGGDKPSPTIVAFASSGAPVPSASLYCGPDSYCPQDCYLDDCSSPDPMPTDDSTTPDGTDGSGSGSRPGSPRAEGEYNRWRNIAIGVGVSLGVTALVAGIAITVIWGRVCRGAGYAAGTKDTEGAADSGDDVPSGGPVMSPATTSRNMMQASPVVLPPGTLPVIREEDHGSRAPQLPAVATTGPITPPEPVTPSKRDSIAVSAVSSEDGPVPESTLGVAASMLEAGAPKPTSEVPAVGTEAEAPKSTDAEEPVAAAASEGERPRSPKGKEVERRET